MTEFECLVQAGLGGESTATSSSSAPSEPLSSFADALKTYKLSWKIRLAAEESAAAMA